VFIKQDGLKGPVPSEPAVLDQKGCQYTPHVLDVTVGQKLEALNSDSFLHNVHTLPENNPPLNKAQPAKGQKDTVDVKAAERFKVKCDVHPWMSAWVYAFDHPYHATTAEDGTYEIKTEGLKDGSYTIVAWQEKFGELPPQKVTIKGGKADKPVNFSFKQKAAAADPAPAVKEVKLASVTGTAEACCEDGACDAKDAKDAKVAQATTPVSAKK